MGSKVSSRRCLVRYVQERPQLGHAAGARGSRERNRLEQLMGRGPALGLHAAGPSGTWAYWLCCLGLLLGLQKTVNGPWVLNWIMGFEPE